MTSLPELDWEEADMYVVERGFHEYMETLMSSVIDGDADADTESGYPFCGCDTCVVRETMAFLIPRIVDMWEKGLLFHATQDPSKEGDSDGVRDVQEGRE